MFSIEIRVKNNTIETPQDHLHPFIHPLSSVSTELLDFVLLSFGYSLLYDTGMRGYGPYDALTIFPSFIRFSFVLPTQLNTQTPVVRMARPSPWKAHFTCILKSYAIAQEDIFPNNLRNLWYQDEAPTQEMSPTFYLGVL